MVRSVVFVIVVGLFGCAKPSVPPEGLWQGTVTLREEKQVSFQMKLTLQGETSSGYFLVGDEQTPIPEVYQRGDSVLLEISEYGAAVRGVWDGESLKGNFLRFRTDTLAFAFEATPLLPPSSIAKREPTTDVPLVGKFQVYFHRGETTDSSTTATFWVKNDSIYGTFIAQDGDYGLMVGKQHGDRLQLNRFTGWQANVLDMERANGVWTGKYYARKNPPVSFTLEPRVTLPKELPGARLTRMKVPRNPFAFSGVTIAGDTVTHLDPRFKGKVLLIDIMGTWCHNCMDAAPLLQQLYKEFNPQGLEIIGLSFELSNDYQTARKNLMLYQERFGITFPLLFCGTIDEPNVNERLHSQVEEFFAYPTTFFVGRDGRVKKIHVGFKGPGIGEEFQQQVEEYYEVVRDLLKSK